MNCRPRKRGFTLIELMVVIAIIVLLMAILFPVFSTVRRKAHETQCFNNLSQLASALKEYRRDHGRFPAAPFYDAAAGVYRGGFSDLYPDYIDSTKLLICPEDQGIKPFLAQAQEKRYSSYNGLAADLASGDWTLQEVYYNYNGYDVIDAGGVYNSTGVDNGGTMEALYQQALMSEYAPKGLRLRAAPRLKNRSAPDNTIITHCVHHRATSKNVANQRDFVLRLDGSAKSIKHVRYNEDPDANGPKIAPWISQLN
jgi:prepilin-type N-terminal cleavage/methylation domain-containing protein